MRRLQGFSHAPVALRSGYSVLHLVLVALIALVIGLYSRQIGEAVHGLTGRAAVHAPLLNRDREGF